MQFFEASGRLLVELLPVMAGAGLIIGSLAMTGVAHAFSRELVALAGGNVALLLILGALTSFILGMGMSITACYVFLAIVLAPALVMQGFYPLAVHLFIMYWGMISFISPPIAFGAFAAAGLAGSPPMKTGFQAMRLGAVIFILPFFFVINPGLVLHGTIFEILHAVLGCVVGVIFLGASLEGYLIRVGKLIVPARIVAFAAGFLLAFPEWRTDVAGAILALIAIGLNLLLRGTGKPPDGKT
jgi:TRAP-type uncharacterized transport system fused permease subunit